MTVKEKLLHVERMGSIATPTVLEDGQVKFRTRIIGANVLGSTGYYTEALLQLPSTLETFKKGTHMHQDHQSWMEQYEQPAGSLDDFVGVIESDPVYEADNPEGAGLYADVKVFSQHAKLYKEMAPYIGVSIKAWALSEEATIDGIDTRVITEFIPTDLTTVDFVTHPGAEGRITSILEKKKSVLPEQVKLAPVIHPAQSVQESKKRPRGKSMDALTEETGQAILASLKEAVTGIGKLNKASEDAAAAEEQRQKEAKEVSFSDLVSGAVEALDASELPKTLKDLVIARVDESVKAGSPIKIEDAIAEQKKLLESLTKEMGGEQPTGFYVRESGGGSGSGRITDPTQIKERAKALAASGWGVGGN